MTTYQVITNKFQASFIPEINANVAKATFKNLEGLQVGDLYSTPNECDIIVGRNTCQPVNTTFVKQFFLKF